MNFRRGKQREEPEINLVPMIDVMLVILIFLMITTTYSKYTELQINLPTADAEKQPERPNEITVVVNAQGQYTINRAPVAFTSVEQLAKTVLDGLAPDKLHEELLNPLVDMTFNALVESGELPPAPPELQGMPLKVKYTSILAQAARMVSVAGIDRFWGMIGAIAPLKPEILDKINPDQLADTYGESLGIPPAIINSNDDVAEVRQQRAQQQQQADTLAAAESASKSAKSLAEAAMGGDSALSRMVANVGGSPQ